MPTRRFHNLSPERRAKILEVAAAHLARSGPEAASYNQIIAEAGISKTSAYLYFDGKDDLVAEVFREAMAEVAAQLGPWRPAPDAAAFWRQLREGSEALQRYLAARPEWVALLAHAPTLPSGDPWLQAVVADGQALGVIRADIDRGLLLDATAGVLRAADAYVLRAWAVGGAPDLDAAGSLLAALWRQP